MDLKTFQEKSTRTLNRRCTMEQQITNCCLGIVGEGGEVIDQVKKHLYQGHPLIINNIKRELGDVMFYIVNLANLLDIDMEEVLQMNMDKLEKRYPKGFSVLDSINR